MRARLLRTATIIAGAIALALLSLTVGAAPRAAAPDPDPAPAPPGHLVAAAQRALGLTDARIATLDLPPSIATGQRLELASDDLALPLVLRPVSVRADEMILRAQVADGSWIDVDPEPVRTFRGVVEDRPGSVVAGSLLPDGLHATVRLEDGATYWVQPLAGVVPGAAAGDHVIYRDEDVLPHGGTCGVTDKMMAEQLIFDEPPPGAPSEGGIAGTEFYSCAELGVDADFEFYTIYGSVASVENRVELVINLVNLQYETEVDITHNITAILVRTSEPDPYSTSDPGGLLNQFTNEWNSNQAGIPRDVAHLFTGRDLAGFTIGIAWTGTVCTTLGYSLVQHTSNLGCATDLSAHELGHNWNADHCNCPAYTMNASQVACPNTFHPTDTIPEIVAFRISRTCLELCDGEPGTYPVPFSDTFPTSTPDPDKWTGNDGVTANLDGIGEPSPPLSANINGSDQLRSARLDADGASLVTLSYWWQRTGNGDSPEPTEDLFVEYRLADGSTWVTANQHLGDGPDMTAFEFVSINLPSDSFHSELRVRFRGTSALADFDDFFVDDVNINILYAPSNDNCAAADLVLAGQTAFTSIGATTDGPDESGGGCGPMANDIWFKYINPCEGVVTVSVCDADFDTQLAVYQVCPGGPDEFIACNDDFCGQQSELTFNGVSALYRVRIAGAGGATGSGMIELTCTPGVPCPGDCGVDDDVVDIQDLLALLAQWGGAGGCDIAPAGGDGVVDIQDLLDLLGGWGGCP